MRRKAGEWNRLTTGRTEEKESPFSGIGSLPEIYFFGILTDIVNQNNRRQVSSITMFPRIKTFLFVVMVFFYASPSLMAQSSDPLPERLRSGQSFVRLLALQEVGRFALAEQVHYLPLLVEALEDKDADVQLNAAALLASLGNETESAVPVMVAYLREPDSERRDVVMTLIFNLRRTAIPALIDALRDEDPNIRLGACRALGKMGKGAEEAIPALIDLLDEVSQDIPDCASVALGKIGKVDDLIEIIKSGSDRQRELISKNAFYHLPEEIDPTEALIELVKNEESRPKARLSAVNALGSRGSKSKNAVSPLVAAMADQEIGFAAASALGKIGLSALSNTIEALGSTDFIVRSWAAYAIKSMEQPAVEAVPSLIKLLDDKELVVSLDARSALERIGTPKALDAVKRSGVNLR